MIKSAHIYITQMQEVKPQKSRELVLSHT